MTNKERKQLADKMAYLGPLYFQYATDDDHKKYVSISDEVLKLKNPTEAQTLEIAKKMVDFMASVVQRAEGKVYP